MFSEEKLSQAGQKANKTIGKKSFYSNTSYGFEYKKLHKGPSIKYIRREGEKGVLRKAYIYCFGGVIPLLNCVQGRGLVVKYLAYLRVRTL